MIFWTDVGEVGFLDYQKRLKRKQIAIQMATDLHADVTPEKALKMISKAIEAQEKHDVSALCVLISPTSRTHKFLSAF